MSLFFYVAPPEATPSRFFTSSLHLPRCARAPLGEKTRSAQRNIKFSLANKIILIRFDALCQTSQESRQLLFLG